MVMCFAPSCKHYSEKHGCKFFVFPKDPQKLKKWTKLIRRGDRKPSDHSRVCDCHFINKDRTNGPTIFDYSLEKQLSEISESVVPKLEELSEHEGSESPFQIVCAIHGCKSKTTGQAIEFFPFPKNEDACQKWIEFCKKPLSAEEVANSYICSLHFEETSYLNEIRETEENTILIRILSSTALPTLKPPTDLPPLKLDPHKYGFIKTRSDLLKLRVINSSLKERIRKLEKRSETFKNDTAQHKATLELLETEFRETRAGVTAEEILSKVFSPSQIKLVSGSKMVPWSKEDLAVGCTLRYLGNRRFYHYLTRYLKFPLPADSSMKKFVSGKRQIKVKNEKSDI